MAVLGGRKAILLWRSIYNVEDSHDGVPGASPPHDLLANGGSEGDGSGVVVVSYRLKLMAGLWLGPHPRLLVGQVSGWALLSRWKTPMRN